MISRGTIHILDACCPLVPQLVFGTSWIIMCSDSGLVPISSNAFVTPFMSFSFCSRVLPSHISTITTGMNTIIPTELDLSLRTYSLWKSWNDGNMIGYVISKKRDKLEYLVST